MTRTIASISALCAGSALFLSLACSSDSNPSPSPDGGTGGSSGDGGSAAGGSGGSAAGGSGGHATGGTSSGGAATGGTSSGGSAGDAGDGGGVPTSLCAGKADQIACGKYIVEHLDACGDCHTPRLPTGAPDTTKTLAGDPAFADLDPTSATIGLIPTPNLTQLAAKGWTDTDIKNAIQKGKDKNGQGLFPIMPYRAFANMADVDAEAVAKYILSLTPIGTKDDTPSRQPLPGPLAQLPLPIPTLDPAKIPNPVFAAGTSQADKDAALFGKYLAAEGGPCVDCHSPQNQDFTLDATKLFAGGQTFQIGGPFGVVTSLNITQANNGIHGWAASDVAKVIQQGVDKDGTPLCPPMPFGPRGAFGGLQASDVNAIAQYIIRLPAIENPADGGMISMCVPPGPPPTDSGADATSTDASSDASKTD